MGRGRSAAVLAAVLVLGAGAAGCGDDSEDRAAEPEPPSASSSASGESGDAGGTDEGAGATAPKDPAKAEKQVKENWEKFFDPKVSNEEKADYLENGERMKLLLEAFNNDKRGKQVQAEVTKVTFTSASDADVDYTLLLKKATALPNAKGAAVEQDDTWKVSVKTLCALVKMSGTDVPKAPGC